jgi:uncharacterized SAM-binding protein YcdF (DUF218 family)
MFFIASKLLGFFAQPSNLLIILGLAGVALLPTRRARAGLKLMTASVILLAIFGLSPLVLPLEQRFPAWDATRGQPDGAVVLGGAIEPAVGRARDAASLNEAAERMTAVAALARQFPAMRIVFSGGSGALLDDAPEAEWVLDLFESFGIARSRVALERQARNTAENAVFSKALAAPKAGERWLLVTSGYHMPRSIGVFRRAGFPVEAYPVDYRTRGWSDLVRPFSSLAKGLRRTDVAVHEWVGLLVYRLAGRTSALFPGPD